MTNSGAPTRLHGLQLKPGHDLLDEITRMFDLRDLSFAVVVSAVGSLAVARIRPAVASELPAEVIELERELEIMSLTGTLIRGKRSSSHLHLAVADSAGHMTGGHLKKGCQIRLGAKIVLASTKEIDFEEPAAGPSLAVRPDRRSVGETSTRNV